MKLISNQKGPIQREGIRLLINHPNIPSNNQFNQQQMIHPNSQQQVQIIQGTPQQIISSQQMLNHQQVNQVQNQNIPMGQFSGHITNDKIQSRPTFFNNNDQRNIINQPLQQQNQFINHQGPKQMI
jgi:hypothetical protein